VLCPSCGEEIAGVDTCCHSCGSLLTSAEAPSLETVKQPFRRSREATVSLAFALLSFALVVGLFAFSSGNLPLVLGRGLIFTGFLAGLLAIMYGHEAKESIRQSGARMVGRGRAIAGLGLGYPSMVLCIILASLYPLSQYRLGDGNRPVGALRTIDTAATTYASTYNRGFPPTLEALRCAKNEDRNAIQVPNERAACLIDEELASGIKAGYRITYIPGPPDITGKIQTYTVHADPINPGATGDFHYFTDQSGIIRGLSRKEASENDSPVAG